MIRKAMGECSVPSRPSVLERRAEARARPARRRELTETAAPWQSLAGEGNLAPRSQKLVGKKRKKGRSSRRTRPWDYRHREPTRGAGRRSERQGGGGARGGRPEWGLGGSRMGSKE